ncbi:HET-domain-containing protein, partial [Microthyrium microscopicum]
YATLSYCWGGDQSTATRTHNYVDYLQGICLASLPKTIQDAVTVARKLDLKYLWIDSMCIIQDSEDHKRHEIGRMESIYYNSYITISASWASNCHEGMLKTRKPIDTMINLPFQCANKEIGTVSMMCWGCPTRSPSIGPFDTMEYYPEKEPINDRAWTLQESFMSRRRLIFTQFQVFWTCRDVWGSDGGRQGRPYNEELSCQSIRKLEYADWISIAEGYSRKDLTDPTDKLDALSSIASYFSRFLQDQYLAGLWEKELLRQLCWRADTAYRTKFTVGTRKTKRSEVRCAPSWSFLSIMGPITFKMPRLSASGAALDPVCSVLGCDVEPISQEAPFGKVSHGRLTIKGHLLQ